MGLFFRAFVGWKLPLRAENCWCVVHSTVHELNGQVAPNESTVNSTVQVWLQLEASGLIIGNKGTLFETPLTMKVSSAFIFQLRRSLQAWNPETEPSCRFWNVTAGSVTQQRVGSSEFLQSFSTGLVENLWAGPKPGFPFVSPPDGPDLCGPVFSAAGGSRMKTQAKDFCQSAKCFYERAELGRFGTPIII